MKKKQTKITCPLTGELLFITGESSDKMLQYYATKSENIKYTRSRTNWTVMQLDGTNRYFIVHGLVEAKNVDGKWLPNNTSVERVANAKDEQQKRKQITTGFNLIPNIPLSPPDGELFIKAISDIEKPNISISVCPLVEHIHTLLCTISNNNIEKYRKHYKNIQIGDQVYEWHVLGRSGDAVFRTVNNIVEYIDARTICLS
jgi:hypothetical protein